MYSSSQDLPVVLTCIKGMFVSEPFRLSVKKLTRFVQDLDFIQFKKKQPNFDCFIGMSFRERLLTIRPRKK